MNSAQQAVLAPAEQVREAGAVLTSLAGQRRTIQSMLDTAQQRSDIIKVNCLSDKLTQMDVAIGSAREQQGLLNDAVGLNNDGQRNHHYTVLTLLRGRAEGIMGEARQCVGEERENFSDRATTSVQVSSNIPTQDTTSFPASNVSVPVMMNNMSPLM